METRLITEKEHKAKEKIASIAGTGKMFDGLPIPKCKVLFESDIYSKESDVEKIKFIIDINEDAKIIYVTADEIISNFKGDIFLFTKKGKILTIENYDFEGGFDEPDYITFYSEVFDGYTILLADLKNIKPTTKLPFIVQKEWPFKEENIPKMNPIENPENEYQEFLNSLI